MNDYQIIQDIGRSKHAMVYKGRKKKTIQFFALKCVDKSQKHKIMREVRFLHRLQTPYAVHFYEWFETANHLWLILELCPGNRLIDLLQADLKLPEESVSSLALNLLAALQFLHSNGIVFNNLKPSSVLIDGSGLLKLADFSLAMHTNTYNGPQSEESKRCKRGTPTYMAPELFRPDGVSSFSSDLWSLGCVMYELASGRPPVLKSNFKALVTAIITEPYNPIVSCSEAFNSLCSSLLAKGLLDRPDWEAVRQHPFWQHELPYADMPADPALEEFCEVLMQERREMEASMDGAEQSPDGERNHSPQRIDRSDPVRSSGVDLNRLSQQVLLNRERDSLGSYRGQTGGEVAAAAPDGQRDVELTGPDDEVDFEPEDDEGEHARQDEDLGAAGGEQRGEVDDDEEYGEQDFAHDSLVAGEESVGSQAARILPFGASGGDAESQPAVAQDVAAGFGGDAEAVKGAGKAGTDLKEGGAEALNHLAAEAAHVPAGSAASASSKGRPISAPISTKSARDGATFAGQIGKHDSLTAAGGPGMGGDSNLGRPITAFATVEERSGAQTSAASIEELLFCVSDQQVRPIVGNKKIESVAASVYDAAALPFEHLLPPDLEALPPKELDAFFASVHRALGGKTAVSAKSVVLAYLERLAFSAVLADGVLNSELGLLMVRILRETKSVPLRAKVAQTLGALIRNAAFISPDLQHAGALVGLSGGVRDRDLKVRRRSMAALGELLYYISSQGESEGEEGVEGQDADGDEWTLPAAALAVLLRALSKGEDDVVQHYAAQALDNLSTQLGADGDSKTAARLAPLRSLELVSSLFALVSSTKVEALRGTSASALSRVVRFQPALGAQLVDKVGVAAVVQLLVDDNVRVQQAFINVLNVVLLSPSQRALKAVAEEEARLLHAVLSLLDHGTSVVVRAKAVLCLRLLAALSPQWLTSGCDKKLLATVEKLQRDKDHYLRRALEGLVHDIATMLPAVVTSIARELSDLCAAAAKGKGLAPGDPLKPLKPPLSLVLLLLHAVTSPSVRAVALSTATIRALGDCISTAEVSLQQFAGSVEFRRVLHLVVESLAQQPALLLQHHEVSMSIPHSIYPVYERQHVGRACVFARVDSFCARLWHGRPFQAIISHLLPALVQAALRDDDVTPALSPAASPAAASKPGGAGAPSSNSGAGGTRYLCLRAVSSILAALMNEREIYDPSAAAGSGNLRQEHAAACTKMVHELLVRQLLPKYPALLSEKDHSLPVPQCAVRIAALVMSNNPAFGVVLQRLGLVGRFVSFLSPDSPQLSVHVVSLVRSIVQAAEGSVGAGSADEAGGDGIDEHQVSERVGALVEHMERNKAEDLYEATLDMVSTLLYQTVACLQDAEASEAMHAVWLARAEPILAVSSSLCSLCHSQEEHTCDTAAQCVLLLAHLFPADVLAPGPAALHIAEALRIQGATVRKRLLKTLLWVVNSGDLEAVYDAVVQVEPVVGDLAGEEGAIGELATDVLDALQQGGGRGEEDDYGSEEFEEP